MHIQMWLCLFCTVWTDLILALVIAALIHSFFSASVYECRLFAIMWPAGDRLYPFHKAHEWVCMCAFMKIQAYMIYMLCGYFCINVFFFFFFTLSEEMRDPWAEFLWFRVSVPSACVDKWISHVCMRMKGIRSYQSMCRSNICRS